MKTPNPIDIAVGTRVRAARMEAHMSQEKVADKLGLTFQQLQKYEKGTNRIGSSRIKQLSEILNKPVFWFFEESGAGVPGGDLCSKLLATSGGVKLAEAYLRIPNGEARTALTNFVEKFTSFAA